MAFKKTKDFCCIHTAVRISFQSHFIDIAFHIVFTEHSYSIHSTSYIVVLELRDVGSIGFKLINYNEISSFS